MINRKEPDLLAVGDKDGCLHLLKLPTNLIRPAENEVTLISDFFKREKDAVEYFKSRFEIRMDSMKKKKEEKDKELELEDIGNNRLMKNVDQVSGTRGS